MRIRRRLIRARLALVLGTFAGLALTLTAAPVWAGQLNLLTVTSTWTVLTTVTNTNTETVTDTQFSTFLGTLTDTSAGTVLSTTVGTDLSTVTDTITDTLFSTTVHTVLSEPPQGPFADTFIQTLVLTQTNTHLGTHASTTANTVIGTTLETLTLTAVSTFAGTLLSTELDTFLSTTVESHFETIFFDGQPADVSIEITQEGLNLTSPFNNRLTTNSIVNDVDVTMTAGLTQVQANVGNANVTVGTNSIIDGQSLVDVALAADNAVAVKEIGVLTLVPGFAVQNSTKATTAHIAGLALAAAEATAVLGETMAGSGILLTDSTTDGTNTTIDESVKQESDVVSVSTVVDIRHKDINEYSPHDNVTLAGFVHNSVRVAATTGLTQVQANAGNANVAGAHNLILINGNLTGNGGGLNFNR